MTDKVFSSEAWRYLTTTSLKSKDNVMIPEMLALALRMDGWYVLSSIIWAKGVSFCPAYSGSVMPESVTDRPTTSHEHVFLLTKQARYYYDAEAVRERWADERKGTAGGHQNTRHERLDGKSTRRPKQAPATSGRNLRSVWTITPQPFSEAHFATFPTALVEPCIKAGTTTGDLVLDPFAGSGTVGCVALKLGRKFVGIELNPAYCTMAQESIMGPLFT
jgi:DNA modification methylase